MSLLTLSAKLERVDTSTPWGFRMQGGKDFSAPLTIQRVTPGSLAAKCGLEVGDVILKIGSTPSEILVHKEAQQEIIRAGNSLELMLQRGPGSRGAPPAPAPVASSTAPPPFSNYGSPGQNYNVAPKPYTPAGSMPVVLNKQYNTPMSLYSMDNVMDSLTMQTKGLSTQNRPASGSETSSSATLQMVHEHDNEVLPAHQSANRLPHKEPDTFHGFQSRPSGQAQSRSFKMLQEIIDSDQEMPQHTFSSETTAPQAAVDDRSVTAVTHQQYNSPLGLYSSRNVMDSFQGQMTGVVEFDRTNTEVQREPVPTKDQHTEDSRRTFQPTNTSRKDEFIVEERKTVRPAPTQPPPPTIQQTAVHTKSFQPYVPRSEHKTNGLKEFNDDGTKIYRPSETYMLIRQEEEAAKMGLRDPNAQGEPKMSRSFQILQQSLGSPGSGPVSPGRSPGGGAPPTRSTYTAPPSQPASGPMPWTPPTGPKGKTRFAKKGEARFGQQDSVTGGRIPICHTCGSAIRGPFVVALDKTWCPDHFNCANPQCGAPLIDRGFVEEHGQLFCETDYERYYAPDCGKCHKKIIGEYVNALNQTFHPHCFLCSHCRQPIGTGSFHLEDSNPYCEKDWQSLFQTKCYGCQFPIEPGDRWVEALSQNWHSECFNCSSCQVNLEGQGFFAKAGKPYCKKHAR